MTRFADRRIQIAATVVVLALLFLWNEGFLARKIRAEDVRPGGEAHAGPTVAVELRDVPEYVEVAGTVRADRSAALSTRMIAVVEEVLVTDGAQVASGDLLARLSAPDLDSKRTAASAAVQTAEAVAAQARRESARVLRLAEKGVVTGRDRERAETELRQAESQLARAVAEARSVASVAGYQTIVAPFAGVITRRHVDPGDLVSPGSPMLEIADVSSFRVEADVSESIAMRLAPGSAAEVAFDATGDTLPLTVTEVVPAADPASRTMRVKLALAGGSRLVTGLFARVKLTVGAHPGLVVPETAIHARGEGHFVYAVSSSGAVEPRWVRLGRALGGRSREIVAGVFAGDRLVVSR